MKKTKMLVSVAAATIALLATYTTAFADIGAYTVKDAKTNVIRQYDLKSLSSSAINSILGLGNDLLFKDFQADQAANGVNSIYDDSKKYVPFEDAKKALESSTTAGQAFDLNKYLKDAKAGETPTYVYERKVKADKVVNGLNITKEGAQIDLSKENLQDYEDVKVLAGKVMITNGTVKGKLIVDAGKDAEVTVKNVTGDSITGLSGSLKLEGVVAKELVVEKALTLNVDTASTLTKLVITAPKGAEVVLSGNLGIVELNSAVKLVIAEGTTVQVKVATEEAKDTTIVAGAGSTVTTDKPVANTEGSGTVTTNPGTSTGGYTPTPTVDHSAVDTLISNIITKLDALDNIFNANAGYFGVSKTGTTINVTLPDMTSQQLFVAMEADKNIADILTPSGPYNDLRTAITAAGVNKDQLIAAFKANIDGLNIVDLKYNDGLSFVQNLLNVLNYTDKATFNSKAVEFANIPDIKIGTYTVTSITIGTKQVYNINTKKITKSDVKEALGVTGQTYANIRDTKLATLLGQKNIVITIQDANGNPITYTIDFN